MGLSSEVDKVTFYHDGTLPNITEAIHRTGHVCVVFSLLSDHPRMNIDESILDCSEKDCFQLLFGKCMWL